ncbi:MAG: hypothetical protein ABSB49_10725 [Polyangia bacterium]|jgi:hypothetical protein
MHSNPLNQPAPIPGGPPAEVRLEKAEELGEHLARAAEIAAQAGFPPEAFAAAAWQAYLTAAPEVAERLAERQFEAALEEMRKSGRMAKA